jgi:hypothetical protein
MSMRPQIGQIWSAPDGGYWFVDHMTEDEVVVHWGKMWSMMARFPFRAFAQLIVKGKFRLIKPDAEDLYELLVRTHDAVWRESVAV